MAIKVRRSKNQGNEPDEEESEEQQQPVEPAETDPFLRSSTKTISWFSENQNVVLGGVVAVVVAAIGIYFGYNYMQQQQVTASAAVSDSIAAFEKPVKGSPVIDNVTQQTDIESLDSTFDSLEQKWQAVFDEASAALEKYGDDEVGQQARLMKASAAIRLEKYDEAIKAYQAYLEGPHPEENVSIVHYGLAVAHGSKGNVDKAVSALEDMAKADDELQALALYQKGIFYEKAGKSDQARKMYEKALEEDPKSPYKLDINRRLALL